MSVRLPTHVIVSGLIRRVNAEGGFATVIAKGERDAGTMLVVLTRGGADSTAYERMPQADGTRKWAQCSEQDNENKSVFSDYLERRRRQDPDLWIVELDVPGGERFIADLPE